MASWVGIANAALSKIGSQPITALTQANTRARLCNERLPEVFKIVLESHFWACAKKQITLSPLADPPVFGWSAAFQLPVDYLRIKSLEDSPPYEIVGKRILSNEATLELTYIYAISDPTQVDTQLSEAVALYLAKDICVRLTEDQGKRDDLDRQYQQMVKRAKTVDSQGSYDQQLDVDSAIESRFSGGGARGRD